MRVTILLGLITAIVFAQAAALRITFTRSRHNSRQPRANTRSCGLARVNGS